MKKIISMNMPFVMIIILWGCAPKKTTEVAPTAPSTNMENGITSQIVYATGLAEGYNELCLNCKNAVGMDTILGVYDSYGNLVYVSFNGVDITGSI